MVVGFLGSIRPSGVAWYQVVAGLVALPVFMVALGAIVGHYRSRPLRLTGPVGTGINCAVIIALSSNHVTGPAVELFYGATLLAAAWRGQPGCEATVISNLLLGRDDQVGCPLFSPIDHAQRRHRPETAANQNDQPSRPMPSTLPRSNPKNEARMPETARPSGSRADAELIASFEAHELLPHVVRLLARGVPVTLDELAEASGELLVRVRSLFDSQPGVDWDDQGRLVGFGLTLALTSHRFAVDGHDLYTWCAADTLMFTVMLGCDATVHSTCPVTGQSVQVELAPQGPVHVEPPGAVVSELHLAAGDMRDFRTVVCDHGHFFASPESAASWLADHPDGRVLSVADAFDAAREMCEALGWVATEGARR